MRVWERNVGVTLGLWFRCLCNSCNSVINNLSPRKNSIYLDGGVLDIHWNKFDDVIMTGEIAWFLKGFFNG